jgi:hypothetical protein
MTTQTMLRIRGRAALYRFAALAVVILPLVLAACGGDDGGGGGGAGY